MEQQNRAVALSYYTCAPLAWLPLACVLGALATTELVEQSDWAIFGIVLGVGVVLLGILLRMLMLCDRLVKDVLRRGQIGRNLAAGYLLATWLALAAVCLGAAPLVGGFLWLVVKTW